MDHIAPVAEALTAAPTWVPATNGELPDGAVVGGHDGEDLYIARARFEGSLTPGKLVQSHAVCYIPWGGAENPVTEYEVLCNCAGTFVKAAGSEIPENALPAGESEDGETIFIGRAEHDGTITIGKVQASHGVCYIPYGGQELAFQEFEVFCTM